jgi:hypothetical protein
MLASTSHLLQKGLVISAMLAATLLAGCEKGDGCCQCTGSSEGCNVCAGQGTNDCLKYCQSRGQCTATWKPGQKCVGTTCKAP